MSTINTVQWFVYNDDENWIRGWAMRQDPRLGDSATALRRLVEIARDLEEGKLISLGPEDDERIIAALRKARDKHGWVLTRVARAIREELTR